MNKKTIISILKWVISIGLIAWLYRRVEWNAFLGVIKETSPFFLLAGFGLIFVNNVVCAYKWKLFLKADSLDQSLPYLVKSYWIGFFVSMFLPSNIGGDSYRVYNVGSKTKEGVRSFTSVFADRFTGFLALVTIGLVGSIMGYAMLKNITIIIIMVGFLGLFVFIIFLIVEQRWAKFLLKVTRMDQIGAITKGYESFVETFRKYGSQPKLVAQTMLLSFLFHLIYISIVFTYGTFIGIDQSFAIYAIIVPIVALVEALPISIYGLGIRDSAYVYLFSMAGVSAEQSLALSLVFVITNMLYASFGGVLMQFKGEEGA